VILIDTIPHLLEAGGITGYRGGVIRPIFLFYPTLALQAEELFPGIFCNRRENLTPSLGRNILTIGVLMQCRPLGETAEWITILQDKIIGD